MSQHKIILASAVVAGGTGVALVVYLVFRKGDRDNPFKEFVHTHPPARGAMSARDKRKMLCKHLKTNQLKEVPKHFDVICIGSGLGSLTTAALLAKAGRSVLVLEQHAKLGGHCHTFIEGPFEFDTGLHYVGDLSFTSSNFRLLEQLTEGQLIWASLEPAFDELVFGKDKLATEDLKRFRIHGNYDKWQQSMSQRFPDEEDAIKEYIKYVKYIRYMKYYYWMLKTSPKWVIHALKAFKFLPPMRYKEEYFYKTASDVINKLTSNEDLKACMLYFWGGIACTPNQAPFFALASMANHFISDGAFYPVGGPAIVPYYLSQTILKHGGYFFTKAEVSENLVRDTKNGSLEAYGVILQTGSRSSIQFNADVIVSGVGLHNTFLNLVSSYAINDFCPNTKWLLDECSPSISYFNIFVAFSSKDHELDLPSRNFWIFNGPNYDEIFDSWISEADPFEALEKHGIPMMFVTFPSAKDTTIELVNKTNSSTCVAITLTPYSWFKIWDNCPQRKADREYEKLKDAFARKMWQRMLQVFPFLQGKRKFLIVGTPVTHNFYLKTFRGQVNGIRHDMKRFSEEFAMNLRAKTEIKNLYLTGKDTVFCGASGSLTSAMFTASSILGRNLHKDLKVLYKRNKA